MKEIGEAEGTRPGGGTPEHLARLGGAVGALLATPDGRYFLRWLILGTGVLRAVLPRDHAEAAFDAGQRGVGLSVLRLCVMRGAGDIINNADDEVNDD